MDLIKNGVLSISQRKFNSLTFYDDASDKEVTVPISVFETMKKGDIYTHYHRYPGYNEAHRTDKLCMIAGDIGAPQCLTGTITSAFLGKVLTYSPPSLTFFSSDPILRCDMKHTAKYLYYSIINGGFLGNIYDSPPLSVVVQNAEMIARFWDEIRKEEDHIAELHNKTEPIFNT